LTFSTDFRIKSKTKLRNSCLSILLFSISDNVFSRRPVNSRSNNSWIGKVSTSFLPSSVQMRFFCCCSIRSEEHTSELQSRFDLVCRLLLEKKKRCGLMYLVWP